MRRIPATARSIHDSNSIGRGASKGLSLGSVAKLASTSEAFELLL